MLDVDVVAGAVAAVVEPFAAEADIGVLDVAPLAGEGFVADAEAAGRFFGGQRQAAGGAGG